MKLVLTIFVVLFSTALYGQEFSGVKVGQNLKQVKARLIRKGFQFKSLNDKKRSANFEGTVGRDEVSVFLAFTAKTNTVWMIDVFYSSIEDSHEQMNKYAEIKNILIKKYGQPIPAPLAKRMSHPPEYMLSTWFKNSGEIDLVLEDSSIIVEYTNVDTNSLRYKEEAEAQSEAF